jgi:hypothetical protein
MERLEFSWGLRCCSVVANTAGGVSFVSSLACAACTYCTLYLMCFVYTQIVGFCLGLCFAYRGTKRCLHLQKRKFKCHVHVMYQYI